MWCVGALFPTKNRFSCSLMTGRIYIYRKTEEPVTSFAVSTIKQSTSRASEELPTCISAVFFCLSDDGMEMGA